MKFGGGKCFKLRFGAGVEGVGLGVEKEYGFEWLV